jgi:hypothetical protein
MGCGARIKLSINKLNPQFFAGDFFIFDFQTKTMRTKTLLFLLLIISSDVLAQVPEHLQTDTKKIYVAFDEIDIDKLSAMILSPSEPNAVYDKLDAYFLNDQQKFRYVFTDAKFNYSDVKEIDGHSYCAVSFRNVIRITYFNPIEVTEVQKTLKEKFKAQSVVYEKARNSFLIVYNAKMVASLTNGAWQFAFIDQTLPTDISEGAVSDAVKKALAL